MATLNRQKHPLSRTQYQIDLLEKGKGTVYPSFESKLAESGLNPLKATGITVMQVNVGKMCNQVCLHCHVDAGPDRKEIMTRETMEHCLEVLRQTDIPTVDLTGGAPELNPDFRWFVGEIKKMGRHVLVRCNLTIIVSHKRFNDLPEFFREHEVEVVSSLPYFSASRTDAQRGDGVFEQSIEALKMLNAVGYGVPGSGLSLHLVYNPAGAFMPDRQDRLEKLFKEKLEIGFGVVFNNLFTITNLPISRFLEYLDRSGKYDAYMQELIDAYNPVAAEGVMCRFTLSIGWDGQLYDCDFNQMLDLPVNGPGHISQFLPSLHTREVVVNQHCFGCTAGAGSSCGGAVV